MVAALAQQGETESPESPKEDATGPQYCGGLREQEAALSALGVAVLAGGMNFGQFGGIPLLLLMFVALYFLMIAPNQRKQKTWAAMLAALKAGDKVTTNGGIRGTIVSVKDDVLIVKTAPDGVKLEFVKSAIAAVTTEDIVKS
jgi:preprotein translocase subunit YajC